MPFIPAFNTVQAELVYRWNGETVENVLHFLAEGAPSEPEMTALGAHLVTWFDTSMQPIMVDTCQLVNVKLTDMNSEFSPGLDYSTGLPLSGTVFGESMPNNVSLVISKRTIFRGRSYRGRIYQVGIPEAYSSANTITPAQVTNMINAWKLLMSFTAGGENWTMVVVSRYSGGAARTEAVTTPVINMTSDGIVDSQRRRLPGRGT